MNLYRPLANAESRARFARVVEKVFAETCTADFHQGFDAGVEHARRMVEATALRAGLSSETHSARIEQVLRCVLQQIDRETELDKPSKVS